MTSPPVLVIGLDGGDFRYLNEFTDVIPTIQQLRQTGTETCLDSTHPPWTGSAWPSMYTGVGPSHHGVYDFFDHRNSYPDEANVVTRQNVRAPAIWNYLTDLGLRSIVVNVPITHPADEIEGILIPGYLASADEDGYPPGIRDQLSQELDRPYEIYSEYETEPQSQKKIDGYEELIRHRADAASHLLETENWDFAFVQVQKTDAVFHNSSSPDDFKRIYAAADDLISQLIDGCDEEPHIIICSDHGIGPVTGNTVYINQLLENHGMVVSSQSTTSQTLSEVKEEGDSNTNSSSAEPAMRRLGQIIREVGLTPITAYNAAKRLGVENHIMQLVPDSFKQSMERGVNWRESEAYCRRASEQGIRINLEGREPSGTVSPERYEEFRDEIISILSSLKTKENEPIFEFIRRREEVYDGPYIEEAPDILFRTTDMNHDTSTKLYGQTLRSTQSYNHKKSGVFILSSPDIDHKLRSSLSLVDVAPTIFSLLEQPIPERMTGDVPTELTNVSTKRQSYDTAPPSSSSYSQDQSEVTERLSDLGYL